MYVFNYPYIYNSLDIITLYNLLNEDLSELDSDDKEIKEKEIFKKIEECLNYLILKIKEKKCIFNEQKLKELQIKLIEYSVLNRKVKLDFYQIRFLFQDIDFCLKIFLYLINLNYFNEVFGNIINSFISIQMDKRINNYINYEASNIKDLTDQYKEFDDHQMKTLNNSLKIKNTLIIGQKSFHDFIKDLKLPTNTFYLTIDQLVDFAAILKIIK